MGSRRRALDPAAVACVGGGRGADWVVYASCPIMKLMVSKRVIAVFIVGLVAFATWTGFEMVDLIQVQRTREVFDAIARANAERAKKGQSLEAAQGYVDALRAIDPAYVKPELRAPLEAYVRGFEEGLELLKDGKDTASADAKITAAHQQLVAIAKRYE